MQIDVDVVVLVACGCGCEKGHSPALAGRDALAEETLIVSLSGFMRQTQAPIFIDLDVCCTHIKKVWGCGLCLCVILRIFTRATAEQRDIQNFNTMWSAVCVDTHTHTHIQNSRSWFCLWATVLVNEQFVGIGTVKRLRSTCIQIIASFNFS